MVSSFLISEEKRKEKKKKALISNKSWCDVRAAINASCQLMYIIVALLINLLFVLLLTTTKAKSLFLS